MLRIIAGQYRGRKLEAPALKSTRPTTDRVRENMFNLVESYLVSQKLCWEDITGLDAFAGSGALGCEALSRGIKHMTFFEQNPQAFSTIKRNVTHLLPEDSGSSQKNSSVTKCFRIDATKPPKPDLPVDLVFLDPPYGKNLCHHCIMGLTQKGWLKPGSLLVLETALQDPLSPFLQNLSIESRHYGDTKIDLLLTK